MTGSTTLTTTTRRRRPARALTALAVALAATTTGLAACGDDSDSNAGGGGTSSAAADTIQRNAANASQTVTLGSKNFTEQKVLGEIYAQALEAAGYKVKREFNLGDEKTALAALKGKQIDAYPEYTGTALGSFFNVSGDDVPKDPQQAFDLVKTDFAKEGITALPPTPFTNSNEVGVTQETATKYSLTNISDLAKVDDQLTLSGSPECRSRLDCLKGLQQTYGLDFKKYLPVDVALRHDVLKDGRADVSILFTTDPQIAREKFVLLKDDKQLFPPYNSTVLVRDDVIARVGGDFASTIEKVNGKLDARAIQELNAKVDLDKSTPKAAATSYLQSFGYIGQ